MNIFDIWVITVMASFLLEIHKIVKIYKELADQNYKFNPEKFKELINSEEYITKQANILEFFLPIYNLMVITLREDDFIKNKEKFYQTLIKFGAVEEMTEEEIKEYGEYKFGIHAIVMEKNRLEKEQKIEDQIATISNNISTYNKTKTEKIPKSSIRINNSHQILNNREEDTIKPKTKVKTR